MHAHENGENLVTILSEARPLHVEDVTSFKSLRAEVMSELTNVGKVNHDYKMNMRFNFNLVKITNFSITIFNITKINFFLQVEGIKWRCFPLLNNLLKGFRRGELTVLSGSTGSGKTTLMGQYSLDLAEQGVRTFFYLLLY